MCVFSVRSLGMAPALDVLLEQVTQLSLIHRAQAQGQSSFHKEDWRNVELIKTKMLGVEGC